MTFCEFVNLLKTADVKPVISFHSTASNLFHNCHWKSVSYVILLKSAFLVNCNVHVLRLCGLYVYFVSFKNMTII